MVCKYNDVIQGYLDLSLSGQAQKCSADQKQ